MALNFSVILFSFQYIILADTHAFLNNWITEYCLTLHLKVAKHYGLNAPFMFQWLIHKLLV